MITIAIVEDNDQFRNGLEAIIQSQNEMVLAGSYESAEKALLALPDNPTDIVISDINLPGMRGTNLILQLKIKMPQTQFMVCSIHDDDDTVFEAMKYGASGYILKNPVTGDDIIRAIYDLYNGGSPMSPFIARKVISSFQKPAESSENSMLSIREKEVLELLAKGLIYKEIADKMGVSHETVKKHLKNIYQKLHVQNKIEALKKMRLL
ncbi:MAG: response regulator transcription factor [Chitinophagaceae bacterium]|jgi:NarL family two-component system response regulator LiaR|nr:response regulator transcription factor [Microcystis sp. M065S1]MCA6462123.1 response regulator transcription factor [Chitinophagaceae bacterium]MCA6470160.1 response regulator transcription factor [Chitinophagaceae bacterium]MCA6478466.1 response regulator transcription factor [Chitinophagaceae bacterium]MCA6479239.1 response regulator transcription factor [Chitinophagaceae bacterium]